MLHLGDCLFFLLVCLLFSPFDFSIQHDSQLAQDPINTTIMATALKNVVVVGGSYVGMVTFFFFFINIQSKRHG